MIKSEGNLLICPTIMEKVIVELWFVWCDLKYDRVVFHLHLAILTCTIQQNLSVCSDDLNERALWASCFGVSFMFWTCSKFSV